MVRLGSRAIDVAKKALEKAAEIALTALEMFVRRGVPWIRPQDHARMIEGLRKAGYPRA